MKLKSIFALRIVLFLSGVFIVITGLNVGLGGMRTLGWQGSKTFLEITDSTAFAVQDSHIRFMGGLWVGIGLLFLASVTHLKKYQPLLSYSFLLIFLGGLVRLFQFDVGVTLGPNVLGSFCAEIFGMPLLYFWLSKVTQTDLRR